MIKVISGLLLLTFIGFPLAGWAAGDAQKVRPIDACALLSDQDVVAVMQSGTVPGTRSDDGYTRDNAYSSTCFWKLKPAKAAAGEPAQKPAIVILNAMRWTDPQASRKFLQDFVAASKDGTIPGSIVPLALGDESLWWGDGVALRVGSISVGVSAMLPGASKATRKELSEQLAQRVLKHKLAE